MYTQSQRQKFEGCRKQERSTRVDQNRAGRGARAGTTKRLKGQGRVKRPEEGGGGGEEESGEVYGVRWHAAGMQKSQADKRLGCLGPKPIVGLHYLAEEEGIGQSASSISKRPTRIGVLAK